MTSDGRGLVDSVARTDETQQHFDSIQCLLVEMIDLYLQPSPIDFEIQALQTKASGPGHVFETGTDTFPPPRSERENLTIRQRALEQFVFEQGKRCHEPVVTGSRRTGLEFAIGNTIQTADTLHTAAGSVTGIQSVAARTPVAIHTVHSGWYSAGCNTRSVVAAAEHSHSGNPSNHSSGTATAADCYSTLAGCIVHYCYSSDANHRILETTDFGPGIRTGHLDGIRLHTVTYNQ